MSTIDTVIADLRKAIVVADPILSFALIAIKATGIGGPIAAEAVTIIQAAARTLEGASTGAMTSEQAMAHLAAIQTALAGNNMTAKAILDAADAALNARFPTT
jgi:hypothetical protein